MYNLDRLSMEKLHKTFIRPILEYCDVIWDNCTNKEKLDIEAVQMAAARACTGAKRGTSHQRLYIETGWEKLEERRKNHKLCTMLKIKKGKTSEILRHHCPEPAVDRHQHHTRAKENLTIPQAKTTILSRSFFHQTPRLWNDLPRETRNRTTIEAFKEDLNTEKKINHLYYKGIRTNQINHARIRLRCSNLNSHMYDVGLCESPSCRCGEIDEDPEHFLLTCPIYARLRGIMTTKLHFITNVTVHDLLHGNKNYSEEQNILIFSCVQNFIKKSKRF